MLLLFCGRMSRLAALKGTAEQAYKHVLKSSTGGASPHKFIAEMMEKNKVRSRRRGQRKDRPRGVCGGVCGGVGCGDGGKGYGEMYRWGRTLIKRCTALMR